MKLPFTQRVAWIETWNQYFAVKTSGYFPVQMEDMQANLEFNYIEDQPIRIGDVEITWEHMFHPGSTVGYKMAVDGRELVFIPDNEFLKGYMGRCYVS